MSWYGTRANYEFEEERKLRCTVTWRNQWRQKIRDRLFPWAQFKPQDFLETGSSESVPEKHLPGTQGVEEVIFWTGVNGEERRGRLKRR